MRGYKENIEKVVVANRFFRTVLYTSKHSLLVIMTLKPGEEIGEEVHTGDQFFRFEVGKGKAIIDGNEYELSDGDVLFVPAGARHNIINISDSEDLRLYTLYSPPHHKDGIVQETREEAEKDVEEFDGEISEEFVK